MDKNKLIYLLEWFDSKCDNEWELLTNTSDGLLGSLNVSTWNELDVNVLNMAVNIGKGIFGDVEPEVENTIEPEVEIVVPEIHEKDNDIESQIREVLSPDSYNWKLVIGETPEFNECELDITGTSLLSLGDYLGLGDVVYITNGTTTTDRFEIENTDDINLLLALFTELVDVKELNRDNATYVYDKRISNLY